jgi:hypothetical protein
MSSPNTSSSISLPSDDPYAAPVYADELSNILNQREAFEQTIVSLNEDPTGSAILRMFLSLSRQINRTEQTLDALRREREEVFEYAISNTPFRRTISGTVRLARERQRHRSPAPYHTTNSSSSVDSPRTVEIHLEDASAINMTNDDESVPASFHTTIDDEPGTQQNPIDVDRVFERIGTPHPTVGILHRTYSAPILMYCTICARHGHIANDCICRGPIICDYCREVGHMRGDCVDLRRDIRRYDPSAQFCIVCNENGHSLERCHTLRSSQ